MSANLLEKARANRILALNVLEQRGSNLFILEDARKSTRRLQEKLFFTSRRNAAGHAGKIEQVA